MPGSRQHRRRTLRAVEEFRPAHVVAADAELVTALRASDMLAMGELIDRYGAQVSSVAAAASTDDADSITHDVFVQAWRNSTRLEPRSALGDWLYGLTMHVAAARGGVIDDARAEGVWSAASAIGAVSGERRAALSQWYRGDIEADTADQQLVADRARIERKLAGRPDASDTLDPDRLLSDSAVWSEPAPDLAERVQGSIEAESVVGVPHRAGSDDAPGRLVPQRLMRPILIGLLCAFVVLAVMIVVLSALSNAPRQPDFTVELVPTGVVLDVEGEITVTARDAGFEIELDAPSLPRRGGDQNYRAVLLLNDGTVITVGSFREGEAITMTAGVETSEVVEFLVARANVGDVGPVADTDVVLKASNLQR